MSTRSAGGSSPACWNHDHGSCFDEECDCECHGHSYEHELTP